MRKEETVNRNITLTFDFLRQIIKNPEILNDIPDGSTIDFIQKDIPIIERKKDQKPNKLFKVKYQFEAL